MSDDCRLSDVLLLIFVFVCGVMLLRHPGLKLSSSSAGSDVFKRHVEYQPNESSLTEQYFQKMGLQVRYFMPPNSVAPLAFYFFGDLLNDYTSLELISTISTMGTFQKIYRPEIYNANAAAEKSYQPHLKNQDHS